MKSRRSLLSPALLVPVVLVLLAFAWFGYRWYAVGQEAARERARLLDHIAIELDKEVVDAGELSRLTARIHAFPDHAIAADLLAAEARIELVRGRPDRAVDLFVPVASQPGARPEHLALAARILLRRHEAGMPSRGDAVFALEMALAFADLAHAHTQDVGDLLNAWLAAMRLSDKGRLDEFAARIEAEHPETAADRLVRLTREFSLTTPKADVERVRAEFDRPPAELEAMLAQLILGSGDVPAAVSHTEGMLSKFAGVVEVRMTAGVVFHACVRGSPEGSPDRRRWAVRRDAQFDWLFEQAAPEDPRRSTWAALRDSQ